MNIQEVIDFWIKSAEGNTRIRSKVEAVLVGNFSMAQRTTLNKEVVEKIKAYLHLLESSGVGIEKGILFGSYSKGTAKKYSDIDLCVVSPKFGKDPIAETVRLKTLTWDVDPSIEVVPYSPKDLACEEDPLAHEIRKYGQEIEF